MKIIRQGNYIIANRIIKFSCENCGCVFEADKDEYTPYYECKNKVCKVRAMIFCPCCGRVVCGSYNKQ